MGLDAGGIEQQFCQLGDAQNADQLGPAPFCGPAVEAFPKGIGFAEPFVKIGPDNAGFGDEHDGVNEEPVVLARAAGVAGFSRDLISNRLP